MPKRKSWASILFVCAVPLTIAQQPGAASATNKSGARTVEGQTARVNAAAERISPSPRQRISLDADWKFYKYGAGEKPDNLIYDVRPAARGNREFIAGVNEVATDSVKVDAAKQNILKPWILPTGNEFIADATKRYVRPTGDPGSDFPFVQAAFDDSGWQTVTLPHDWAIQGPFYPEANAPVGGGMGRLPSPGVAWYRRKLDIPASDAGKSIFLDVDGAMSYTMVWLNGKLVGGWPYGYNSWRLDLTPYLHPGGENQLAMRLDNPPDSSRWYPGGGIYRNVWLVKVEPVHIAHWGTWVTTPTVSKASATIDLQITLNNDSRSDASVSVSTDIYALDANGRKIGKAVACIAPATAELPVAGTAIVKGSVTLLHPKLWGPPPTQTPNRYVAVTRVSQGGRTVDTYETPFGVREIRFDPNHGLFVNGEHIYIKGADQHHDLGALGAAFNVRAAQRQLSILREMGCNSIRTAHNPPAPELLELADRMGFLVMEEVFDSWERTKTPLDFHLIFDDWSEQDLRAMIRRDRNHPSIFLWSYGNEVGEQNSGEKGAELSNRLHAIANEEDPTRPKTASMNSAPPNSPFPATLDVISLNYRGEGIRVGPAYRGLPGVTTPPAYQAYHDKFPHKLILSSETAAAFSSRGVYLFPVYGGISAPALDGQGADAKTHQVSSYELYTDKFGASADQVFAAQDQNPFVAGGFVWSGWDYIGEPAPFYSSRSSYYGVIDLAGFKKDRFYLYQAHWRPDLPMAHILPHWTWPERVGQVTPVHVFTSGDEAELFLNGKSLGRKKKAPFEYRLRWDDVVYQPGELKVVAYKDGKVWATDVVKTAGTAARLELSPDRTRIDDDGRDLSFITVRVTDANGVLAPRAENHVKFQIEGPGEIVATENGDPTNFTPFPSPERDAFRGMLLVIVRAKPGQTGTIRLIAQSQELRTSAVVLQSIKTVP